MPLRKIQESVAILVGVNRVIATVLFALLTGVVALQVLTRFVLHAPIIWSEEVARFLFFWVVLLGAAMSVKDRRHFVIDVTGETSGARLHQGSGGPRFAFCSTSFLTSACSDSRCCSSPKASAIRRSASSAPRATRA